MSVRRRSNVRCKTRQVRTAIGQLKPGVLTILLVMLLIGSTSTVSGAQTIPELWKATLEAYDHSDHDTVIVLTTEIIDQGIEESDPYFIRALAHRSKGDNEAAIQDLTLAVEFAQITSDILIQRAYTYTLMGAYEQAVADYSQVIGTGTNVYQAYWNRGILYNRLGMVSLSIKDLDKAITLSPVKDAALYRDRAVVLTSTGEISRAIEDYRAALKVAPEQATLHYEMGLLFQHLDRHHDAVASFSQAIQYRGSERVDDYFDRGISYAALGEYEKARKDFSRVVLLDPKDVDGYVNRAWSEIQLSLLNEAIDDCSAALSIDATHAAALFNRASAYERLRNYRLAAADYQEVIRLLQNSTDLGDREVVLEARTAYEKLRVIL